MAGTKNISNLDVARTVAREAFADVYHSLKAHPVVAALAGEYSSGAEIDNLSFGVALNAMREWLGEKEYGSLEFFSQTVRLKRFERTLALPRLKVDYDPGGQMGSTIRAWIEETMTTHDEKVVFDTLVSSSGGGPTAFDGLSLINDAHVIGSSTHDNKTTTALSPAQHDAIMQAVSGWTNAAGEPLGIVMDTLIVGPKNKTMALEIIRNAERIKAVDNTGAESGTRVAAATVPNVYQGDLGTVIVWDRLTGAYDDYYYYVCTSKSSKAMVLKRERQYELIDLTDMRDQPRFDGDKYVWSIEGDLTVAAGAPPCIYAGIL